MSSTTAPVEPAASNTQGKHLGLALAVISAAQVMIVLDSTIVNVALPTIQRSLHFSTANLEWLITAYALTFGGLLLFGDAPATCTASAACSWSASLCSPPHPCSAVWPKTRFG